MIRLRQSVRAVGLWSAGFFLVTNVGASSQAPVTADVSIVQRGPANKPQAASKSLDASGVVVWLLPLDEIPPPSVAGLQKAPEVIQHNKSFQPHVLAIQVGSEVRFPNMDPFFHNIFSLFDGKRFDLGLYEAGTTRTVRFDRAGVSFLFCNIHPEMSAVIVAVATPYFGTSSGSGHVEISDVPDGRYQLNVWYERSMVEDLKALSRPVRISAADRSLDPIRVIENPDFSPAHKNKYGEDYVPPPRSGYVRP
jgi:plastocyanin